jgi:hypothetical protein
MDIREKNWIAIIGSREPTDQQRRAVIDLIKTLNPDTDAIISGCAYGIDALALATGQQEGFDTIGILPWASYNPDVQCYCTLVKTIDEFKPSHRAEAYASVEQFHPFASRLSQGAVKLHARNYGIVRWAKSVIAAPSNKPGGGGTGQGIRLVTSLGIPITIIKP